MQEQPEEQQNYNPLRHLTPAQFMALGGNAVVYVKPIKGSKLAELMSEPDFESEDEFQLVVSADGSPLLVADNSQAVAEWLSDRNYGVVALH
ncbi:MAG: DUF1150 family protein [Devosia sp.]|nr:DUF1150 family protein [Devosia sp.]